LYARYPDAFDFLIVFTLEPLPVVEIEEAIRGFWPGRFSEVTRGRGTMLTEFPSD